MGGGTCYSSNAEPVKDAPPKPKPDSGLKPQAQPDPVPRDLNPTPSNQTVTENEKLEKLIPEIITEASVPKLSSKKVNTNFLTQILLWGNKINSKFHF